MSALDKVIAAAGAKTSSALDKVLALTRVVRTNEGARKYGEPIGSQITKDMLLRKSKKKTKKQTGSPAGAGQAAVNAQQVNSAMGHPEHPGMQVLTYTDGTQAIKYPDGKVGPRNSGRSDKEWSSLGWASKGPADVREKPVPKAEAELPEKPPAGKAKAQLQPGKPGQAQPVPPGVGMTPEQAAQLIARVARVGARLKSRPVSGPDVDEALAFFVRSYPDISAPELEMIRTEVERQAQATGEKINLPTKKK